MAMGIRHVVTRWTGGKIGSGYTNMYFDQASGTAQQAVDAVAAFFKTSYGNGVYLPNGISLSWPGPVDELDESNGHLTNSVAITPPGALTGGDAGSYAALGGGVCTWLTADFNSNGHRVRGRTFLCPVGSGGLQADGTLSTNFYTAVGGAATTLIAAAAHLRVWHRPSKGGSDGISYAVTGSKITDQVAFLTSRR